MSMLPVKSHGRGMKTMRTTANPLQSRLRTTGRRLTGQRQLLLQLLEEHGGHLDAHELFRLASEQNPRLSLSTVYRTMNLLRDLGFVNEVHLGEEHHHYELRPSSEHCHVVCMNCGKVVEIGCELVEQLKANVVEQYDFEITDAQVDLVGLCGECRRSV
jgi:Fur family transcriptional regulator, ferric uptake regulator